MRRRNFGSLIVSLGYLLNCSTEKVYANIPSRDFASLIDELTEDDAPASHLGTSYLAMVDGGRLAQTLRRLRARNPTRTEELRDAIADLTREDLACRDMVIVDGWVLARAEAEVLALV